MRILVADAFPQACLSELSERAHEVAYEPDTTADQLPGSLEGHDVLVVRSTRVTAAAIDAADTLNLVIRAGSGTNTIDCEAASRRRVHVCNVPGRNAVAVAELACALLLALDRGIADNVADLRAGRWDKKRHAHAQGIFGRRVGIIGLGQIGLAFAERAAALGTSVYAVAKPGRPRETLDRAESIGMCFLDDLHALAQTCDVLSLHVPANDGTRHMINRDLLAQLRHGAILLNTSRSELVDEDALIEAMETKGIRAGIDVFADEPGTSTGSIDSRLAEHPNVYGTHHIGASTEQAQQAVAAEVVRMIEAFTTGTVLHCVNADTLLPDPREQVAASLRSGGAS